MGRILFVQIAALFVALAASAQYNTGGGYTNGGFGGTGTYDPNNPQGTVTTPLSLNYIYQFVDSLIVIRRAEMKKCVDTLALNGQSIALKAVSDALQLPLDENEWIRFTDFYMRASLKVLIYLREPFHTMASKVYTACYLPPVRDVEEVDALIKAYLTPSVLNQTGTPGFPTSTTPLSTFGNPTTTTTTTTLNASPSPSDYYQTQTSPSANTTSSVTPAPASDASTSNSSQSTGASTNTKNSTSSNPSTPSQTTQTTSGQTTSTQSTPTQTQSTQPSGTQKTDPKKSSDSNSGIYIPNYE